MRQNFKTDIIYYATHTDFELEFNLCGCCRMRLFNDKCSDKKSLLLALSKAVSRSRVIIVTAPLFSDENIFGIIASAIGSKTEKIVNSDYNISSDAEIKIIKGALPLVTDDGIFGGCIIESGPQSLIVLTDNKDLRKKIMRDLIHPYITELAFAAETKAPEIIADADDGYGEEEPEEAETQPEAADEPAVALQTEEDTSYEEAPLPETVAEEDTPEEFGLITDDVVPDSVDEEIAPEEDSPLITDTVYENPSQEDYVDFYTDDNYDDEDYYMPGDGKPSSFNIWMLVISVIVLLSLLVLSFCIFYIPAKSGISSTAYLKDIFDTLFK